MADGTFSSSSKNQNQLYQIKWAPNNLLPNKKKKPPKTE